MALTHLRVERPQRFWVASIWFAIGLFDATQTVFSMRAEGMHHNWVHLFVTQLFSWVVWAWATPIVLRLGRKHPPVQLRPFSVWLMHIAACVTICLLSGGWNAWLQEFLNPFALTAGPEPFVHLWFDKFFNGLLSSVILYGSILAISYVLDSRDRLAFHQTETARLNEQLSQAQLNSLRRQIEPHFLFNTLNAIAGLVRERRNDAAVSMIVGLSDFLRRAVEDSNKQQVPLGEEMEFVEKYLNIEKLRFAERLHITLDVPRELLPAQVPSLILQPIVENAVKHGIAKRTQGGAIRITAFRIDGMLTLRVYNDGPKLPPGWEKTKSGTGMANARTRLQSLYGDAFELNMRNRAPNGVEVSISLPFASASFREE